MDDYVILPMHTSLSQTSHIFNHLHHQIPTVNSFYYLLEALVQLAHSYNAVASLYHQCRPKIWQIYPIHPNSMPPLFCWIPAIFPQDAEITAKVGQYLSIIFLEGHVEVVSPLVLPQSPHAAAAATECCFLFTVCWHTDVPFSPFLFYSQWCQPAWSSVALTNHMADLLLATWWLLLAVGNYWKLWMFPIWH